MIDKMIEELKEAKKILEELQEQYNDIVEQYEYKYKECDRISEELLIYEVALRKMSESYFGTNGCIRFIDSDIQANNDTELYDYFVEQAKKELQND